MNILDVAIKILSLIALFYVCCWGIILTKFIFAYARKEGANEQIQEYKDNI